MKWGCEQELKNSCWLLQLYLSVHRNVSAIYPSALPEIIVCCMRNGLRMFVVEIMDMLLNWYLSILCVALLCWCVCLLVPSGTLGGRWGGIWHEQPIGDDWKCKFTVLGLHTKVLYRFFPHMSPMSGKVIVWLDVRSPIVGHSESSFCSYKIQNYNNYHIFTYKFVRLALCRADICLVIHEIHDLHVYIKGYTVYHIVFSEKWHFGVSFKYILTLMDRVSRQGTDTLSTAQ